MRVVLDTNIFVSGSLYRLSHPGAILRGWEDGEFALLTCPEQIEELKATMRKPSIAARVRPHEVGRLINSIQRLAESIAPLPRVRRSPDPTDDFLLALAEAGSADYLVTGDKHGLLALARHKHTRILSASEFAALLAR